MKKIAAEFLLWKAGYDADIGGRLIFEASKDDVEQFYGFKTKKDGQRFMVALVPIGDDEQPLKQEQEKPALRTGPDGKTDNERANERAESDIRRARTDAQRAAMNGLCGLAIKWCESEHFQEWLRDEHFEEWLETPGIGDGKCTEADAAASTVKRLCKIESRKELDTNKDAETRFRGLILVPYKAAREKAGLP